MSTLKECRVVAPTTSVGPAESFDLVLEVTIVNNTFSCNCVSAAITVGGARINEFTAQVPIGGGANPTRVRVVTPVDGGSLPPGDLAVALEKTRDEPGCGLTTCDIDTDRGSIRYLTA